MKTRKAGYRVLRRNDRADIGTTSTRRHWADVIGRRISADAMPTYGRWAANAEPIRYRRFNDGSPTSARYFCRHHLADVGPTKSGCLGIYIRLFHQEGRHDRKYKIQHKI